MDELDKHFQQLNQLHTPFVPNETGEIFALETVHRPYQTVNMTRFPDELYEYSQPLSLVTTSATVQSLKINNPFNTPAQVCVIFSSIYDATAFFAVAIDNMLPSNFSPSSSDFSPVFCQYGKCSYTSQMYWVDFQQFVNVLTSDTGGNGINIILGFRRLRDQFIPRNVNMINELTQ